MTTEMELAKQTLPINNIPKNSVDSVMRVLVIRRVYVIPNKNSRHEGTYRTIILVDEEMGCWSMHRYCLWLEVCARERSATVILLEAAKYLLGCSVQEYIKSTLVKVRDYLRTLLCLLMNPFQLTYPIVYILTKREECYYYRKLMLSKEKRFNFLVRIDMNDSNNRRNIINEEIHQTEEQAPIIVDDEVKSTKRYRKSAKKTTAGVSQFNRHNIIAKETHQAEEQAPIIADDEVKTVRTYRKRAKKTTAGASQVKPNKPKSVKNRYLSELCNM
ncbi:hypothetical protein EJD97_019583 [Solanum chilense]|uniref:Uncharacterized protein n=1 Tax=Solanum chilense TaxID=4083 RepID=A0A6N2AYS7_SOLCI|nr:hypothetical protein EJD97_019583 [Solanum chilense]